MGEGVSFSISIVSMLFRSLTGRPCIEMILETEAEVVVDDEITVRGYWRTLYML